MTRTTFYRKVLEHMGVVAADDPADASDIQLVADRYASLYDMLLTEHLVAWALTGDIPAYAEIPLLMLMAPVCAREFGQDPAPYQPESALATRMLRRQLAKPYIPYQHRADFF